MDDCERLWEHFMRFSDVRQLFMIYPTGKTRKSALFMKRLLECGYITSVLAIVPRSSLKSDVINVYRTVFEADRRVGYESTVSVMTRKEFVDRIGTFTNNVYGIFVDEFHTLVSRSMASSNGDGCGGGGGDDEAAAAVGGEDGYKHKARMAIRRMYGTFPWLFLCAPATPFFTKLDRELRMCVDIFDETAGASVANAAAFFGKRMVLPTTEFVKSIYDVTVCVVGDDGEPMTPSINDITQPMIVQDFPITGCMCNNNNNNCCVDTECYVRRLLSELKKHSTGKHFVVSYHYDVRDKILKAMCPSLTIRRHHHKNNHHHSASAAAAAATATANVTAATATSSSSADSEKKKQSLESMDQEQLLNHLKRRLQCIVAANGYNGIVEAPPHDSIVADIRNKIAKRQRFFKHAYWITKKLNRALAQAMAPASELFKSAAAASATAAMHHHHHHHRNGSSNGSVNNAAAAAAAMMTNLLTGGGDDDDLLFGDDETATGTAAGAKKKNSSSSSSSSNSIQITQRMFSWGDATVYFVLPEDPPALLISVRDAFSKNDSKYILVTNMFFCEGHTIRNVRHMHVMGAFPTCECGTMFQAIGRVCRIHSHDVPDSVVEVRLYDDGGRKLRTRIRKAVERENTIRTGIVHMSGYGVGGGAAAEEDAANIEALVAKFATAPRSTEPDQDVDFSVLTMPYALHYSNHHPFNDTSAPPPPSTQATAQPPQAGPPPPMDLTSMSLVFHFTTSPYVTPAGCIRDFSLQMHQSISRLDMGQRHVHQLIKRGIDPAHSERIIGFVRDSNLATGDVFLTVPISIAETVAPSERAYLSSIRRHVVDESAIAAIRLTATAVTDTAAAADDTTVANTTTTTTTTTTTLDESGGSGKSERQLNREHIRKEMQMRRVGYAKEIS